MVAMLWFDRFAVVSGCMRHNIAIGIAVGDAVRFDTPAGPSSHTHTRSTPRLSNRP